MSVRHLPRLVLAAALALPCLAVCSGAAAAGTPVVTAAAHAAATAGPRATATHVDGFTPVAPYRAADTRTGGGGVPAQPVSAGQVLTVGLGSQVPADATAAVLTVTAVDPAGAGYLSVYAAGGERQGTASLSFGAHQHVANSVTTAVGPNGTVAVYTSARTDVVVDVAGFYSPSGTSRYGQVTPYRTADTRTGRGVAPGRLGPGETVTVHPHLPAGATAAVLNVTAVDPSVGGYLTVYPTGQARPHTSNLSLLRGHSDADAVTVALGPDGGVQVFNAGGSTDLVVDVFGYYSPSAPNGFAPLPPTRIVDTRHGLAAAGPVTAGRTITSVVAPQGVSAVVVDVAAVGLTPGYASIFPGGDTRPATSTLSFAGGQTLANMAVVPVGPDGKVSLWSAAHRAHLVVDIVGYLAPTAVTGSFPAPQTVPMPPSQPAPPSGSAPVASPATPTQPAPQPPPTSGPGSPSAFTLEHFNDGSVVRWDPCHPITYRVNVSHAPAGALPDAQGAVARVAAATGMTFTYQGTTSFVPTRADTTLDGTDLVIAWAAAGAGAGHSDLLPGGNVVGEGGWSARWVVGTPPRITSAYVVVDTAANGLPGGFGMGPDRGELLLHELGHAVGLDHTGEADQIMYPSITAKDARWGAGDLTGLAKVGRSAGCLS